MHALHAVHAVHKVMVVVLSPAAAAKQRGPRKTVQRLGTGSSSVVQAKQAKKKQREAVEARVLFGDKEKRGRARVNAGVVTSEEIGGVARLQERRKSLMAKRGSRRAVLVNGVAPGGTMKLQETPDRADYVYGDEGTAAYEVDMIEFMAGNIDDDGVELKVGMLGDWLKARGHEKALEWVEEEEGWRLQAVRDEKGYLVLPSAISIVEYVFKVRTRVRAVGEIVRLAACAVGGGRTEAAGRLRQTG